MRFEYLNMYNLVGLKGLQVGLMKKLYIRIMNYCRYLVIFEEIQNNEKLKMNLKREGLKLKY